MPDSLAQQLVTTAHAAAKAGLVVGSVGNLSARVDNSSSARTEEIMLVSASGSHFDQLCEGELTGIELGSGEVVSGSLRPSSETQLHRAIYAARPEAGAILHTHAPWSTAIACVLEELPCIHYQMLALGGAVRVAPYRCFGTQELADVTLKALENRNAVLMSNHGATVFADTPTKTLEAMQVLEFACTVYWRAAQLGSPRMLNPEQWREVAAHVARLGYGSTHGLDED